MSVAIELKFEIMDFTKVTQIGDNLQEALVLRNNSINEYSCSLVFSFIYLKISCKMNGPQRTAVSRKEL